MTYEYKTSGVCSRKIDIELDGEIIKHIKFTGGCNGNLQGIAKLAEGRSIEDVIARVEGIDCNMKGTSCPDQLAKALKEIRAKMC